MADSGHHVRDVNIRLAKNDHLPQRGIPAPVLSEEEWKEVEQRFASLGLSANTQNLVQYAKAKAREHHYSNQIVDEAASASQSLAGGTATKTTPTASTSTSSLDKARRLTDATVLLALHREARVGALAERGSVVKGRIASKVPIIVVLVRWSSTPPRFADKKAKIRRFVDQELVPLIWKDLEASGYSKCDLVQAVSASRFRPAVGSGIAGSDRGAAQPFQGLFAKVDRHHL